MNTTEIIPLPEPITATLVLPGSKSYTNRALLLAALTENTVVINNPLFSEDTQAMIACLRTLGIEIKISETQIEVIGSVKDVKEKEYDLDAEFSGTTIRFILALATIIPGVKTIHGKEGLNNRPIKDLVDALLQLGADITYLEKEGYPPLRVNSGNLNSGAIFINGSISSQYISALLMIAPIVGDITIAVKGDQISKPYIAMTLEIMEQFGVTTINKDFLAYIIEKQQYNTTEFLVEGDFSSAGYFFAIAALTKSTITLKNLNPNSKQADKKLLGVFEKMGSEITYGSNAITIKGNGIQPMEIDVTDFPDQAQTLAVLAAFAEGETKLIGVQSLRVKETERVVALQRELEKMHIKTSSTADSLTIQGGNPRPATIDTYGDHRMAMSFAIAGTKLSGIKINDPHVVNKTFPDFWKKLNEIGIQTKNEEKTNIVLIGMRGSGKTTIAKLVAEKLHKDFIDLDSMLVEKVGLPVAQIVEKHGWDFFREKESEVVKEITDKTNTVISTGGGVILRKENVDALKENGTFVFLDASIQTLLARIGDDVNRAPLTDKLTKKEEMEEVWKQREGLYKQTANIMINTDDISEEQTAEAIIVKLKGLT
jgi:3-phosphoshikimate 1-carboxyvinyltransferase